MTRGVRSTVHVMKFWFAVAIAVIAACSPAADENVAFTPPPSTPRPDGAVRLSRQSQPYVVAQKVAIDASSPVVLAPARVAFRDDAVSQVNLSIAGRIA